MTTVTGTARSTARRAANSRVLETLTRMGFIGYGLLHLGVAWLAVQIALGHAYEEGDQSGAFRKLAGQPFGRFLLIAIVVGLVAMAIWQLLLAAIGHREKHGTGRTAERLASLGRTIIYSALAWTAGNVVAGAPTSSADQQQTVTAGLMAHPSGQWLVGLAGLGVVALGIGLVAYGWRKSFQKRLRMALMSPRTRKVVSRLGQVGYVAKGIAFGIVGLLLIDAAVTNNPAKSRGLDAALRTLVDKPFGALLLIVIGTGFAAFGVYCFFQSRYRKVGT